MTFGEIVNGLATCFTLLVGGTEMSIPKLQKRNLLIGINWNV